jgi:hypothetical protein
MLIAIVIPYFLDKGRDVGLGPASGQDTSLDAQSDMSRSSASRANSFEDRNQARVRVSLKAAVKLPDRLGSIVNVPSS